MGEQTRGRAMADEQERIRQQKNIHEQVRPEGLGAKNPKIGAPQEWRTRMVGKPQSAEALGNFL